LYDDITRGIDNIILVILIHTNNNTVEEISEKTGIKKEATYHLLEFLNIAGIVKKHDNRYIVDKTTRSTATLIIDLQGLDLIN
jgi:DNA-binding IclR family transcriptional regulator